jgi:hypothetical protein
MDKRNGADDVARQLTETQATVLRLPSIRDLPTSLVAKRAGSLGYQLRDAGHGVVDGSQFHPMARRRGIEEAIFTRRVSIVSTPRSVESSRS